MFGYNYESSIMDDPKPNILKDHLIPQTKLKKDTYNSQNENTNFELNQCFKKSESFEIFGIQQPEEFLFREEKSDQKIFNFQSSNDINRKQLHSVRDPHSLINSSLDSVIAHSNPSFEHYLFSSDRRRDRYSLEPFQSKAQSKQNSLLDKQIQSLISEKKENYQKGSSIGQSRSQSKHQSILKSSVSNSKKNCSQKVRFKLPPLVDTSKTLDKKK